GVHVGGQRHVAAEAQVDADVVAVELDGFDRAHRAVQDEDVAGLVDADGAVEDGGHRHRVLAAAAESAAAQRQGRGGAQPGGEEPTKPAPPGHGRTPSWRRSSSTTSRMFSTWPGCTSSPSPRTLNPPAGSSVPTSNGNRVRAWVRARLTSGRVSASSAVMVPTSPISWSMAVRCSASSVAI